MLFEETGIEESDDSQSDVNSSDDGFSRMQSNYQAPKNKLRMMTMLMWIHMSGER